MTNQANPDFSHPSVLQTVEEIAEQLAGFLFTNVLGQRADRLVLTIDGPPRRDLGGWGERVVSDLVLGALRAAEARGADTLRADLQTLETTWRAHGSWQGEHYADAVKELLEKYKT